MYTNWHTKYPKQCFLKCMHVFTATSTLLLHTHTRYTHTPPCLTHTHILVTHTHTHYTYTHTLLSHTHTHTLLSHTHTHSCHTHIHIVAHTHTHTHTHSCHTHMNIPQQCFLLLQHCFPGEENKNKKPRSYICSTSQNETLHRITT